MKEDMPKSFDGLIKFWSDASIEALPPESIKIDVLTYLKWLRWQNERIEQLEEILEFYSIRKNYKVQQSIEYGISPSKINVDEGCRARRILGKEEYP